MKPLTPGVLFVAALVCAEDYTRGPDSQHQSGVPKGSVAKYELQAGTFYPGTSDIALTAQATLYFTDVVHKTVGYIDTKRRVHVVYSGGEIAGVALSPDQARLIVTDAQARFSWSFQIAPDGSPTNGEPYYRLEMPKAGWTSGVQGAIEDSDGQVCFPTPFGIQFCEANGRVAGILNPHEHGAITNLVFADKNLDALYVAENDKLFSPISESQGNAGWCPGEAAQGSAKKDCGFCSIVSAFQYLCDRNL